MPYIFISYSRKNQAYARNLADKLLTEGFDVWIDDRIDYGDDWWHTIVDAIKGCGAVVVIMSPASDGSRWVQREITLADELRKPTFPVLLEGDLLNSKNWAIFIRTQYIDARNEALPPADFYSDLARVVPHSAKGKELTPSKPGVILSATPKRRNWIGVLAIPILIVLGVLIVQTLSQTPPSEDEPTPTVTASATATDLPTATATQTQITTPTSTPTETTANPDQFACSGVIVRDEINFRQSPGLDQPIIAKLENQTRVAILDMTSAELDPRWAQVEWEGQIGWVVVEYVGFFGDCSAFSDINTDLYPVPLASYEFVRGFEDNRENGILHFGWDLESSVGEPIYAGPHGGTVVEIHTCTKCTADAPNAASQGYSLTDAAVLNDPAWGYGYGNFVIVRYENEQLPPSTRSYLAAIGANPDMGQAFAGADVLCLYGHLNSFTASLGQKLQPNEKFATLGNTGNSSSPHLSLDCRYTSDDAKNWSDLAANYINPARLFSRLSQNFMITP